MSQHSGTREQWGSKIGFILAAGGSAVGLGNIWRFPYVAGKYGGASFILFYLFVVCVIGFTVMLTEMAFGKHYQLSCVSAFRQYKGGKFTFMGVIVTLIGTFILSYYMVIGGWTIKYIVSSLSGLMGEAAAGHSGDLFGAFISSPNQVLLYHVIFVLLTSLIVFGGIKGGIERVCKVMMPALFVILLVMIVRSLTLPGASKGLEFYMLPDFSKLTLEGCLAAIGQAFFSLSLGMGIMITYGSYVKKDEYLPSAVAQVCVIDTLVAVLAGFVIFPAAFAFSIEVNSGPGLTFITLPSIFAKMPGGAIWSTLFFVLFFFAAITSSISLLEVPVACLIDTMKMSRKKATVVATILVFVLGVPSALGLGSHAFDIAGKGFLDFIDFITNNIGMPVMAALTSLFVGWLIPKDILPELDSTTRVFTHKNLWLFCVRFVAPAVILVIFVTGLKW
ncbi:MULTISPECIES: sodium-dependent transporter [Jonquetella]|uniref:Transporter n=1 Tax=Jonquetella anthropi DSM 22815 TaxID=885272 RepID=H0UKR3_9BACT|nr:MULTISPECIES: sodium-dependent transporter [Jonquetella]EHM13272.1 SNF family Na+-dependent transporter [Jonquetella anthropi DSM 22815]ERL23613.1 sodium:neurotransmitter symporter domain protein [Jonquetella sp. BV3C21]